MVKDKKYEAEIVTNGNQSYVITVENPIKDEPYTITGININGSPVSLPKNVSFIFKKSHLIANVLNTYKQDNDESGINHVVIKMNFHEKLKKGDILSLNYSNFIHNETVKNDGNDITIHITDLKENIEHKLDSILLNDKPVDIRKITRPSIKTNLLNSSTTLNVDAKNKKVTFNLNLKKNAINLKEGETLYLSFKIAKNNLEKDQEKKETPPVTLIGKRDTKNKDLFIFEHTLTPRQEENLSLFIVDSLAYGTEKNKKVIDSRFIALGNQLKSKTQFKSEFETIKLLSVNPRPIVYGISYTLLFNENLQVDDTVKIMVDGKEQTMTIKQLSKDVVFNYGPYLEKNKKLKIEKITLLRNNREKIYLEKEINNNAEVAPRANLIKGYHYFTFKTTKGKDKNNLKIELNFNSSDILFPENFIYNLKISGKKKGDQSNDTPQTIDVRGVPVMNKENKLGHIEFNIDTTKLGQVNTKEQELQIIIESFTFGLGKDSPHHIEVPYESMSVIKESRDNLTIRQPKNN